MSGFFATEAAYSGWLERLSEQYQRSQIKAAVSVNREMLSFYWFLGRDIAAMKSDSKWGRHFYETLSRDLKRMIPGASCFSVTNLKYMTYFHALFPSTSEGGPQPGDESEKPAPSKIHPQRGDEIFCLPWGHIKLIIDKCRQDPVDVVNAPIGISEYELSRLMPEKLSNLLPSIEDIEKGLK